ncbi:hypothetical protein EMIHUDRAFT_198359 [Emiliania huxleyi CCMP1516]|uniref:RING-type E3 ubiquitin transferase n=2 Tax=Emiliania huxleyi TaxID=2903 RepID=A0A0D3I748_EMIH1|nr:hypothetical protein EMIHUDRAFT_198359 [Emiliania huxleyi CCMP1516]EOD07083.1 hypothetical protein EMIHUDRAFT_198359 [Emiliania huxleyi CCMP1516]|eukprot:XP_005759512.1 hypothetical protein EMIHUDRAFT_198359 [Emiliania huxleyi CCMP1516]
MPPPAKSPAAEARAVVAASLSATSQLSAAVSKLDAKACKAFVSDPCGLRLLTAQLHAGGKSQAASDAACALWHLQDTCAELDYDIGDEIAEVGAIEPLVHMLSAASDSAAAENAGAVLNRLTVYRSGEDVGTLRGCGALQALLGLLRRGVRLLKRGSEARAVTEAVGTLANLIETSSMREAVSDPEEGAVTEAEATGFVKDVVDLLRHGRNWAVLHSLKALYYLTTFDARFTDRTLRAVVEAGAIDAILNLLRNWDSDSEDWGEFWQLHVYVELAEDAVGDGKYVDAVDLAVSVLDTLSDPANNDCTVSGRPIPHLVLATLGVPLRDLVPVFESSARAARVWLKLISRSCTVHAQELADAETADELRSALDRGRGAGADLLAPEPYRRGRERLEALEKAEKRRERCETLGLRAVLTPDEFLCPISKGVMRDPVVASDGHTYERVEISRVLQIYPSRSPLTRERLEPHLYPNRALLARIANHEAEVIDGLEEAMQLGAASAQAASPPSEHGAVAPSGGRKRRTAASPGTRSAQKKGCRPKKAASRSGE